MVLRFVGPVRYPPTRKTRKMTSRRRTLTLQEAIFIINGRVAQLENPYEFARDPDVTDARPVKENDYFSDPTSIKSAQNTVGHDHGNFIRFLSPVTDAFCKYDFW